MAREIGAQDFCKLIDKVCDDLLTRLTGKPECDADTVLITHWQEGRRPGFRIQASVRSTGKMLTRFVGRDGVIAA